MDIKQRVLQTEQLEQQVNRLMYQASALLMEYFNQLPDDQFAVEVQQFDQTRQQQLLNHLAQTLKRK